MVERAWSFLDSDALVVCLGSSLHVGLGGRYLYTPEQYKITNEKLKDIVSKAGVPNAQMIEQRGQ